MAIWATEDALVVVNGGIFTTSEGNDLIVAGGNAVININGGTFVKPVDGNVFGVETGFAGAIIIAGGSFVNYDPAADASVTVRNGYKVESETLESGDVIYTVVKDLEAEVATDELHIYTAADLLAFAESVNAGNNYAGKTVYLMNDIDLFGINWSPIGTDYKNAFRGVFDGQGYTIYNLSVRSDNQAGFFGFFCGTAKNINFVGANVNSYHWAGVVAAVCYTKIDNCHVYDSTVTLSLEPMGVNYYCNGDKGGAIVGYATDATCSITNCSATETTVKGYRDIGTVIGACLSGATYENLTSVDCKVEYVLLPEGALMEDGDVNENKGDPVGRE